MRLGTLTTMAQPNQWSIDQDVREDAESIFVPVDQLPSGQTGDIVDFRSGPGGPRRGRVTARWHDGQRGTFLTVRLDDAPDAPPTTSTISEPG